MGTITTRIRDDESNNEAAIIGGLFTDDGDSYNNILRKYTTVNSDEQAYIAHQDTMLDHWNTLWAETR